MRLFSRYINKRGDVVSLIEALVDRIFVRDTQDNLISMRPDYFEQNYKLC